MNSNYEANTNPLQLHDTELDAVTGGKDVGKDAVVGAVILQVDKGNLLIVGYSALTGVPIVKSF
jgi:hypothetical protein